MKLDSSLTFALAALTLLLGRALVSRIPFLGQYGVPAPVAGGLVAALAFQGAFGIQLHYDTSLQAPLMLTFFACIGLNADFASLRKGGSDLGRFLVVVCGLLLLQNAVGMGLARVLGLNPLVGLLAGSITLSGGHGTGVAWATVFASQDGLEGALGIAMACATFGLVLGGLVGGPVASLLIRRHTRTNAAGGGTSQEELNGSVPVSVAPGHGPEPLNFEEPETVRYITAPDMAETLALILVCHAGGQYLASVLAGTPLELPVFVWVLFTGLVLRNSLAALGWYKVFERPTSVLGNVSLSLFLSMTLMSLDLSSLRTLALPITLLLAAQTVVMVAYALFITYRAMGANYDASVLAAGHCGFGLGATPTAITNMQAVTSRYGPAHRAFLLVPIVGAFFMDAANALIIKLFLMLAR